MVFSKLHLSLEQYKEFEQEAIKFLKITATEYNLVILGDTISFYKGSLPEIQLFDELSGCECTLRIYNGHYIIKEIRFNSVGQFYFFHNIESFVIAVNKEIDKK